MSSSQVDAEVLIVGAGIGGLTLAAILSRLDISCKVLERSDVLRPVGAGISLSPNGLRMLDQLGVYDQVLDAGQKLRKVQIWRGKKLWNTVDWAGCEAKFGYPVMSLERHHFHRLLFDAAGGDDVVQFGIKIVDVIDDSSESFVRVVSDDGKEFRAHVVVGADGIRSVIRRCLARDAGLKEANTIKFTGRVHMSGITAPLEHLSAQDLGVANWMLYENSTLTTWPCPDNRQWFIGVTKTDEKVDNDRSIWSNCDEDTINSVYGDKFHPFAEKGEFSDIVEKNERILACNMFQEVEFPSMARGRVCLIGDSAHSMTSAFGQGGNLAIEDAAVLASLIHGNRGSLEQNVEPILQKYSQMREKRTKEVVKFSFRFILLHGAFLPYGIGPLLRWLIYAFLPGGAWLWFLEFLYGFQPTVPHLDSASTKT
ncbi:FAD binding monooxygenase [Colletotrichum scovillei]|uniref:FAD binding monooxygenase n=1 Tax=Colletotrichum scovillei TaxID=1209932 RepID=A0A9P7UL38_9PEZI|nr:FAD binding monooxygenase [Colletotrichum scovillei]KAG7074312.1 FAD binding monooxygenase [Colletotrichum scovillei]KAG7081020.1 FAD binding monooxygenase [Colletotrichum scovillei]